MIASLVRLLGHRLIAAFAVAYVPVGIAAGVATWFNEAAIRTRYERKLNNDIGLPGHIARVENIDLSHRNIHGVTVWQPNTDLLALTIPCVAVEEHPDGSRDYAVDGAVLHLADGRWLRGIRWPQDRAHPTRRIFGQGCTITVGTTLAGGMPVELVAQEIAGEIDFSQPPLVTGHLRVGQLNGYRPSQPLDIHFRLRRATPPTGDDSTGTPPAPAGALEEIRLTLEPPFPLERLLSATLPPAWGQVLRDQAATIAGHLVFRGRAALAGELPTRPTLDVSASHIAVRATAGQFRIAQIDLADGQLNATGMAIDLAAKPAWGLAQTLSANNASLTLRQGEISPLITPGQTTQPVGWAGTLRVPRWADADRPVVFDLFVGALTPPPHVAMAPPDVPGLPPSLAVPAASTPRFHCRLQPVPVAALTQTLGTVWPVLSPLAGLRSGTLSGQLTVTTPSPPSERPVGQIGGLMVSTHCALRCAELSIPELAAVFSDRKIKAGQLDLELADLELTNGWPTSAELRAKAHWARPDAATQGQLTGRLHSQFTWPASGGVQLDWHTRDLTLNLQPWDGPLALRGQLATPNGLTWQATLSADQLGPTVFGVPPSCQITWDAKASPPWAVGLAAQGDQLPLRDIAQLFGFSAPAGRAEFRLTGGRWLPLTGQFRAQQAVVRAEFGTRAIPRGRVSLSASGEWARAMASADIDDFDLTLAREFSGGPELHGRFTCQARQVTLETGIPVAGQFTARGHLRAIAPLCQLMGLPPWAGGVTCDDAQATLDDGRLSAVKLSGRATSVDLAELSTFAGFGRIDGQVDLLVTEAALREGRITAFKAELAETPNYQGSRTVSREALAIMVEKLGLPRSLAATSLDYDSLGATLTLRDDQYTVQGTQTTNPKAVARLRVLIPLPVYLPDKLRIKNRDDLAGWETWIWDEVRRLNTRRLLAHVEAMP